MARKMTVMLEHETEKGWEIVSEDTSSPAALATAKQLAREGEVVRVTIAPYVKAETESDEDQGEPEGEPEGEGSDEEADEPVAEQPKRGRKAA